MRYNRKSRRYARQSKYMFFFATFEFISQKQVKFCHALKMKIVVASDKFKGTLTAPEAVAAIREGIRIAARKHSRTDIYIVSKPMADGGEGSIEALLSNAGERRPVSSFDALMRPVESCVGFLAGNGRRSAVVETSSSAGLYRLARGERNPAVTTSYGVGIDIRQAIEAGYRDIMVALGGTATSDCGAGMLAALGCRFYDDNGNPVEIPAGGDLERIQMIDTKHMEALTKRIHFTSLTDVDNPLLGPHGAAAVFSPQKGADAVMAAGLERGAVHFAHLAAQMAGCDCTSLPGAGAAGGIGWALKTFCKAEIVKGAEYIGSAISLEEEIRNASLVVTGEGRFDAQSLHGKAAGYVASLAGKIEIPVIVLCGTRDKAMTHNMLPKNLAGVYALTDRVSTTDAYSRPVTELTNLAADIFGYLLQ